MVLMGKLTCIFHFYASATSVCPEIVYVLHDIIAAAEF